MDDESKLDRLIADAVPDGGALSINQPGSTDAAPMAAPMTVLQSNACIHDCAFCPLRAGGNGERVSLRPDSLAERFLRRYNAGMVGGLVLSSGVEGDGPASMDAVLTTARLLRENRDYEGRLGLDILPGAEPDQVREAIRLADRVMVCLEAPTSERYRTIATTKRYDDLLDRLRWIGDQKTETASGRVTRGAQPVCEDAIDPVPNARRKRAEAQTERRSGGWGRHDTSHPMAELAVRFVVGASGETDRELLYAAVHVREQYGADSVVFGGFHPHPATPCGGWAPVPNIRMTRLAQAHLLLRRYDVTPGEMPFRDDGYLHLTVDPKTAAALLRPDGFPMELNSATYEELLRVPGIGPLSAKRLVHRRRERPIRDPVEVALCGAVLKRAAPFLLLNGRAIGSLDQFLKVELRRMNERTAIQLSFFESRPAEMEGVT